MRTLDLTNYSIRTPKRIILGSAADFDILESGDLTKVRGGLVGITRWLVYEGTRGGKDSFIEQDPVKPSQIISYRLGRDSNPVIDNKLQIPRGLKEIKVHKPEDKEFGYRVGLLMAAGLWKSPARMVKGA